MTRAFRDTHEVRMAADPEYSVEYMALIGESQAMLGQCSADTPQQGEPQIAPMPTEVVGNLAPRGWIWQCGACGKRANDRYGETGGWDESCMLNCTLVKAAGGAGGIA